MSSKYGVIITNSFLFAVMSFFLGLILSNFWLAGAIIIVVNMLMTISMIALNKSGYKEYKKVSIIKHIRNFVIYTCAILFVVVIANYIL